MFPNHSAMNFAVLAGGKGATICHYMKLYYIFIFYKSEYITSSGVMYSGQSLERHIRALSEVVLYIHAGVILT